MSSYILVLNCGSSSIKFALVEPGSGTRLLSGLAERLATAEASIRIEGAPAVPLKEGTHTGALRGILTALKERSFIDSVTAVGHRVVHGGEKFTSPTLLTPEVITEIGQLSHLAPLHNPVNLEGIVAAQLAFPALNHVAVFDTAFHQTMPDIAYRYAVPESWYTDHGVRRYGFHGTSHSYVAQEAARQLNRPLEELHLLSAHLGNGCSAAAISFGQSVDTSMGMTPLSGCVMGTRSGDVDPGVVLYMAGRLEGGVQATDRALNHQSGLLGLSGSSNDMRQLLELVAAKDPDATLAVEVFSYRLAGILASLAVALPRLDALIFTGGIGERSDEIRERVTARLWPLGLGPGRTQQSPKVLVIPTDEETMIARLTAKTLS